MLYPSKNLSLSIANQGLRLPENAGAPLEDTAVRMDLNTNELQFAGVLLRSVEKQTGKPVVLFASLAGALKPLKYLRRVAQALRQIGGSRVALVSFSPEDYETAGVPGAGHPELNELPHWIASGTAASAEIRWRGANSVDTTIVPTIETVDLFDRLKQSYDVICLDAGDIFASPNVLAVSKYCSGVVLMVERDVTAVRDVERAQRMLLQAGARVLGFVFVERE